MSKPVILYVDDEPRNLTVFEATIPSDWELHIFESAVDALKQIGNIKPWVIVSDQRMPKMTGLEFLEIASQLVPNAIRVIVTGYTEEQTIIQLVRRAKIFDFITKPWDSEDLIAQLEKAIDVYRAFEERKEAFELLKEKKNELEQANDKLEKMAASLKDANAREIELRDEIGAWSPAPIVWAIKEGQITFPAKRDIVAITYDIVGSAALAGLMLEGRTVKSHISRMFTEVLIRKGGIRESASGDSVYGHFGVVPYQTDPQQAALSAAQEFRVALRSFSNQHAIPVECGIAIHYAPGTLIQIHEVRAETQRGEIVQRFFDTDSTHVDLLHRMEKLVHALPGTNIVMSEAFLKRLPTAPAQIKDIGEYQLKGQASPVHLYLIASDRLTEEDLNRLKHSSSADDEKPDNEESQEGGIVIPLLKPKTEAA